jgi:GntR family transcriptional regulator
LWLRLWCNRGMSDDAPSYSPLYQQIKALITRGLQSGEWKPGEVIPAEVELAARFKVSQGTVRKAIDELAAENLVVRRQGKGTFVATHAEEHTRYRFLRLMHDSGKVPGLQRRLLDCRRMRPSAEIARALKLERGEQAMQVRRLLLAPAAPDTGDASETPVVLDDIWLPATLFKGLSMEMLSEHRGAMYGLFETRFDVRMIRAEEQIRAVAAQPEEAALMLLKAGTPLLCVDRLAFTYGDKPVEFRRGLYNTAGHHYRNELS